MVGIDLYVWLYLLMFFRVLYLKREKTMKFVKDNFAIHLSVKALRLETRRGIVLKLKPFEHKSFLKLWKNQVNVKRGKDGHLGCNKLKVLDMWVLDSNPRFHVKHQDFGPSLYLGLHVQSPNKSYSYTPTVQSPSRHQLGSQGRNAFAVSMHVGQLNQWVTQLRHGVKTKTI